MRPSSATNGSSIVPRRLLLKDARREGEPARREASEGEATDARSAPPIRCARCGHRITDSSARIQVDGAHAHHRSNAHGFRFDFGCFASAPGCAVDGTPTTQDTWFSGCAWQYAHCGGCGAHLGWCFTGAQGFFGLILDRLVEPGGLD